MWIIHSLKQWVRITNPFRNYFSPFCFVEIERGTCAENKKNALCEFAAIVIKTMIRLHVGFSHILLRHRGNDLCENE